MINRSSTDDRPMNQHLGNIRQAGFLSRISAIARSRVLYVWRLVRSAFVWVAERASRGVLVITQYLRTFWHSEQTNNEFLPPALELLETPASPTSRILIAFIVLLVVTAVTWASVGRVDIIAVAPGKIMPAGRTKLIQPFQTSIVRAIYVQDGQRVKAGQVLVELDATIDTAERNRIASELGSAELDVARLQAVIANDPIAFDKSATRIRSVQPQQITFAQTFLLSQLRECRAKIENLTDQVTQARSQIAAERAAVEKLKQTVPLLKRQYDVHKTLADKGADSMLVVLSAQQSFIEHQQDLASEQAKLAQAIASVHSLEQQREEAAAEFARSNLDELNQATEKAQSFKEQLVQAEERQRYQTLTTPVDGIVQQLVVHTVGGVVTPGQQLMMVVPTSPHIEIEAMVSNTDIGFVKVGQIAEIKVNTFNFTRYGYLHGRVTSISRDAVTHEGDTNTAPSSSSGGQGSSGSDKTPQSTLSYAARVALDETAMQVDGHLVNLLPGMAVTVEIRTGSRTIMGYLLSPIREYEQDSLKDR